VIFGILLVPLIRSISNQLFIYLQSVQAYISPPIAAVFLIGILSRRVNGRSALTALVSGGIVGALRLILEILNKRGVVKLGRWHWFAEMNFLHFAILLFAFSKDVMLIVSWLTEKPKNYLQRLQNDTPGNSDSHLNGNPIWDKINIGFSVILVLIILCFWGIFF